MSDHLLALYPGRSDVVVMPFSRKTLAEKTRILLGGETPAGRSPWTKQRRWPCSTAAGSS